MLQGINKISPLWGKCVRCISFYPYKDKSGLGCCVGNSQAYKEVFGKTFRAGAPEGPSFERKKLDGCGQFSPLW